MDCPWIQLVTSEHGSICRCRDCDAVRVEFGNVVVQFSPDEFSRFDRFIAAIDVDACERLNMAHRRHIAIDLEDTGVTLTFKRHELYELRLMMDEVAKRPHVPLMLRPGSAPINWPPYSMN